MISKRMIMGFAALALAGCLDRTYDNPFLSGDQAGAGEDWKRDYDGDGIADSVQKYASGCKDGPAECLEKARTQAEVIHAQAGKAGKDTMVVPPEKPDTAAIPPKKPDTVAVPPKKPDTTVIPPKKPDTVAIPPIMPDTLPIPITPRDTVRDTVIVIPPTVAVTGIQAEAIYIPLTVAKARPSVTVLPRNARNPEYSMQSLDEDVAKVVGTDLIPVKAGIAKIRARSEEGGFTTEFQVTVFREDTNRYEVEVSVEPMVLVEGEPAQAPSITWKPADVTQRGYTLASSDPARVLVVMESGVPKCKPVAAGAAQVTLRTLGKGLVSIFQVTVKPAPIITVPVLAIGAENLTFDLGGPPQTPKVAFSPDAPTNKAYILTSDKPDIVAVSGTSLRPVGGGSARITITSVDGPFGIFTATVRVRVQSLSAQDLVMTPGESKPVAVQFVPANADLKSFVLTSENPKIVEVAGNSLVAIKKGSTIITITAADGGIASRFQVKVGSGDKGADDD